VGGGEKVTFYSARPTKLSDLPNPVEPLIGGAGGESYQMYCYVGLGSHSAVTDSFRSD
jgi:hypothetical protein